MGFITTTDEHIASGGTISGDLTIDADLTVTGSTAITVNEVIQGTSIIDVNNAEALLVRKNGDSGDIFTVDTTNEDVAIGGSLVVSGDTGNGSYLGHINNTGSQSEDNGLHIQIASSGSGAHGLKVQTGGSANAFIVSGDGQVGLGFSSSSMVQTLNVNGGTYISGNTLVGHTASMNSGGSTPKLQVSDNDNDASVGVYTYGSNAAHSASLRLAHSKSGTVGSHTVLADNDRIGTIEFNGSDGTNFDTIGARIWAEVDGTPASNRMPSALTFSTAAGGADDDVTERMRIASDGRVYTADGISHLDDADTRMYMGDDDIQFLAGNVAMLRMLENGSQDEVVINEDQADVDFRVESDGNAHALFVQASTGNIGIGGTPTSKLHVHDSVDGASIVHFDNVAGGSSSVNETMALHLNLGDSSTIRGGAKITAKKEADYSTGANMDASLMFSVLQNNAFNDALFITSAGRIGIGKSEPAQPLHIAHATDASIQLERVDTSVADGDGIGAILFKGGESSQTDVSRIRVNADADWTSSSSPTKMIFETTPSGATADAVALTIDSSQNATFAGDVKVINNLVIDSTAADTAEQKIQFHDDNVGLQRASGSNRSNNGNTLYIGAYEDIVFTSSAAAMASQTEVMRLDTNSRISLSNNDSGVSNTIFGKEAGDSDGAGDYNVFVGEKSGGTGTQTDDADYNVGLGYWALTDLTNGESNVAIGAFALENNTSGGANVAIGSWDSSTYQAPLTTNTVGSFNIAIGSGVLRLANENDNDGSIGIGYGALNNQAGTGGARYATATTAVGHKALEAMTTAAGNTAVGYESGKAITTGVRNTAIGTQAIHNSTVGEDNVAVGWYALSGASTSSNNQRNVAIGTGSMAGTNAGAGNNVAVGYGTLDANMTSAADNNVAVGYSALSAVTSGANNTAVGASALLTVTTGVSNVAIGKSAMVSCTTGGENVAIGESALQSILTGSGANIAMGYYAMRNVVEGTGGGDADYNIAIGYDALKGGDFASNDRQLQGNIAIGMQAMNSTDDNAQTGTIAIGHQSLKALTSGANNVAVGYQSLHDVNTGGSNVALGNYAGDTITDGTENTCIGYAARTDDGSATNQTVIGRATTGVADNSVTLGNADVTAVYMAQDSGATVHCAGLTLAGEAGGDYVARFQNDGDNANRYGIVIQAGADDGSGTTNYILFEDGDGGDIGVAANDSGTFAVSDLSDARKKKNIRDTKIKGLDSIKALKVRDFEWIKNDISVNAGLIAQELKEVFPDAVTEFGDDNLLAVSRDRLVPVLIKAVQELTAKVEALESKG